MKPKWPRITWNSCNNHFQDGPHVLGIHPWIHDFAAYGLWSRPAGLLATLDGLRLRGAHVALMDCLDQTWSDISWPKARPTGQGPYLKTSIAKPAIFKGVPRQFSRYGHDPAVVRDALRALAPIPDLVLITTIMTYWYPGAVEAITMVRELWPQVPIVLGGVYASLCPEHAQTLGADYVLGGNFEDPENWDKIWGLVGLIPPSRPPNAGLHLALDLYAAPKFSVILGSRGCPFRCAYCASHKLYPGFRQISFDALVHTIQAEYSRGVRDFVFYDDALLIQPENWLWPLLDWFAGKDVRLHTPNAMHARYLTPDVCRRFKRAGVHTIRLGLETEDFEHRRDSKLSREEWHSALRALAEAGFGAHEIGAYVLFGLPHQNLEAVERTIGQVLQQGVRPELAYYTPIPGSPLFEEACLASPWPLAKEPLTQNNAIWPCVPGGYTREKAQYWRDLLRRS
ncbi:MAG: radical SAM protein [Desulfomicrobium sp.]|nr:radical SAM protein [Desulfomicrobium sp.]